MLPLVINETEKITCINCWEECSTKTFQRLYKEWDPELPLEKKSELKAFSILSDTNYNDLLHITDDRLEMRLYQVVAFCYHQQDFRNEQINVIKLRGKLHTIPKKLGSLTLEQNMHIRKALANVHKANGCLEELISFACAVYMQRIVDGGPYNHDKAVELEKEILDLPIWQTFAVGFFFLSKLNNSGRLGLLYLLQRILQKVKREKQLRRLRKSKGSMSFTTSPS